MTTFSLTESPGLNVPVPRSIPVQSREAARGTVGVGSGFLLVETWRNSCACMRCRIGLDPMTGV